MLQIHDVERQESNPIASKFTRPYNRLTRSAYPNLTRTPYPSLTRSRQCLPGLICSFPAESPYPIIFPIGLLLTRSYMVLSGQINLPDRFLVRLLPTRSYLATLPDFLTQSGNTSLHPTAYPTIPNHLIQPSTLQLTSPKNFLIGLPP
jgi:hypothetical protein